MNLEIKTLYILLYLLVHVTQNNGLVNLNANNDNPLLLKILQSLDTATSSRKLFEVTLKLIESVCVCMQEVLRKRHKSMFLIENNSLHLEDEDSGGSKINLYKKIYNKTCIHLRQELEENIKRQPNINDGDIIRQRELDNDIPKRHITTINENEKQYFALLFQSLISTQDYHTYNIHRHNLYRNKIALESNQEGSVIIIITLHPNHAKFELKNTNTTNEYLLNETLYSHTAIDIDIINKNNLQKNDEILKLDNVEKCHLYSIYTFLIESKKENLIHLYKLLSVKGTIKMYIDILPDQKHINFFSKCCHNDSLLISCKNHILRRHLEEDFVTNRSEQEEMENYRNIITNIKLLVEQFNKKVNTNDLFVKDNIDDLNYTNDCNIERIYTTEQTDVTSNINTSKLYQSIYQNPIKEPTIHANRILAVTTQSTLTTSNFDLAINASNSIQPSNITIEIEKGSTKALSKSTITPFHMERDVTDVTRYNSSLLSTTIIIAKDDNSKSTNSSRGQVNSLKNLTNIINTSNRRYQLKYQIPIKKTISQIYSIFNKTTISISSTSDNVLAINKNYSKQRNLSVMESEKGYTAVVNTSITTPHLGRVTYVTKKYPNLESTIMKYDKNNATFRSSSPAIITLFKDSTNVIDIFKSTRAYKEDHPNTNIKVNKKWFTATTNKNNYTKRSFDNEIITINPVVTTLREFIGDNTYYITNNNTKNIKSKYFTANMFSTLLNSNSNEVVFPRALTTELTTDHTTYFSINNNNSDKNDVFVPTKFTQAQNYTKTQITWRQTPLIFEAKSPVHLKNKYVYQKLSTRPTLLFSMSSGRLSPKHNHNSIHTTGYGEKTKQSNIMNMNSYHKEIFDKYKSSTILFENLSFINIKPHLTNKILNNQQTIQNRKESSSLIPITRNRTIISTDLIKPLKIKQPYNDKYNIVTQDAFNKIIQSPYTTTFSIHSNDKNAYQEKIESTRPSIKLNLYLNKITKQHQKPTQKLITLESNEREKKFTTVFGDETNTTVAIVDTTNKVNTMETEENTVTSSVHLSTPSKIFDHTLRSFPTVLPLIVRKKVYDKTHLLNSTSFNTSPKHILRKFNNISNINKDPISTIHNETVIIPSISYNYIEAPIVIEKYLKQNDGVSNSLYPDTMTRSTTESTVNRSESFKNTYYLMTTKLMHTISDNTNNIRYESSTKDNNKQVTSDALQAIPKTISHVGLKRNKTRSSESTLEKPRMAENVISFYDEIKQLKIFDKGKNKSTTKLMSQNKFLETKKVPLFTQVTKLNYMDTTITSNRIIKHKNNSSLRYHLPLLAQRKKNKLKTFNSKNKNMVGSKKYKHYGRINYETVTNNIDMNFMLSDEVSNNILPDEDYTTPIIKFKNTLNNDIIKLSSVRSNSNEMVTLLLPTVISKPGNFEYILTLQNQKENDLTKMNQNVSDKNIDTTQVNHKEYNSRILQNTINEKKNTFTTNVNQGSFTTESSFVMLETTINNPRIDATIDNVGSSDFNQTIRNYDITTYFPTKKNKNQYKIKENHMPFINYVITQEQNNSWYNFNQSPTRNSLSSLSVHINKSSLTKKAQTGEESIMLKNKLNKKDNSTHFSTVPSYKHTTKGIYSQIDRSTTSNIIQRYLSTSSIGAMPVKLPLLIKNNSTLNITQSKNIEQKTFIPHKSTSTSIPKLHSNINKKESFNCSYLEIIQNVQQDKWNKEALRNKSKIVKSPIKTSSAISKIDIKVTSATLLNNARNENKKLQATSLYVSSTPRIFLISDRNLNKSLTTFNNTFQVMYNIEKSGDNLSQFVFTETTPSFKDLNLSTQRLKSASINNKNIHNNTATPQSFHSNRTLRKYFNINNVAKNDERSSRTYSPYIIEIPLSIENKTIIRNFKNTTQMLNSPVPKSITEANKYVNTYKYHSNNISIHSEMKKSQSNQTKRLSMHSTSSIHHKVDKIERISTVLYQNTTVKPEINKNILSKVIENSNRKKSKSNVIQIDDVDDKSLFSKNKTKKSEIGIYNIQGRKELLEDIHLKNNDKLNNVSTTLTDAYLLYINNDKDQDNAGEIQKSLTFTNITMKDENNATKPATIQNDLIKNKSKIANSVALLYNNERKTIGNFKTTLNNAIFQNSKIHETNNKISYIADKINNDTTETNILLSYKTKKTTLKAFKSNMANTADTKKFINKINSKSTVYSEQTNPLSTSSVRNTTRVKHYANGNENTTKVLSIYTTSTTSKIFTSDMLNDTDVNNVMYELSTKSNLYLEDSHPLIISSFENTNQLKQIIDKKGMTTNIPVTYTTIPLNIKNKKEHKILLRKSSIFTNIATKNETNINNNYARKPIKLDIEKNKSNIGFYENERNKINSIKTQKVMISQKNLKANLNTAIHQNLNIQQTNDNIFYNTNKRYDSTTDRYTTKRTTFMPFKINMSNNTDINNVIDKFKNKSTVSQVKLLSALSLRYTTQLKSSASDKRYTTKIPLTYTKMTTTSKTFKANMSSDFDIKNLMYKFNKKDMVYSEEQLSPLPTSYLKNTPQLKENVYDKEHAPIIPLQYTKRSTTFEAFKAYMTNNNDIKNLMFKLSNESAEYSEKGPPLTSIFNDTKQWQQNTKSIKNVDKNLVTHTTILNIIKNKNQDKESKLKIKKSLTNITIKDGNNTNNSTATKAQKNYHDIVQNKNNIGFYDTEQDKMFTLTIQKAKLYQEDNTTISNIPLSHMYKFDNKSIVYSEGVHSLPTTTFKYTKHIKESANTKENTLTIPLTYTSNTFKVINANISNNIDNKNFMYNFNNTNTIYFEEIPHQTTDSKHSKPLMQIDNSKINTTYKNITSTKSLPIITLMDKINITNKNESQKVKKVEQKTSKFNYINNLYNKDNLINSVTEGLKVSDTYETLHTQMYTRSTLKVLKKAKTIKYNTYKPTEEDIEYKIKPLTVASNKISQRQLQLHHLLSTKSMEDNMKTKKISMKTNVKTKTTKSSHSIIRHEIEAKNARRMNSLDESLLDRLRKTNLYPVVKKPSIKRRKVMKRLRKSNMDKEIPTINTNDIFSLRKNAHLLQKSPQSLYKDLISNPATTIPKQYIIHPKFSKIDAANKLGQEYMRPKPLFLAYDKDFYRDNYQIHHHSEALSLREKVNHIRDSLRKPSSDAQEQAVIERPTYLPKNSKPKFLRDRIYSIRNYLHNNDFVRSTEFPIKHYLEETTTTYSPYIDPLYYFRRSGWYEVRTSTQDPTTVRPTRRKRRTIYFLSPTVPYYRYF